MACLFIIYSSGQIEMKDRRSEEENRKAPTLDWKDILAMTIAIFLKLLPLWLIILVVIVVLFLLGQSS